MCLGNIVLYWVGLLSVKDNTANASCNHGYTLYMSSITTALHTLLQHVVKLKA